MKDIVSRFIEYAKFDTQSKPDVENIPSTEKQWKLALYLTNELKTIGLSEINIDEHAYVMATLPANIQKPVPTIGFIAHMDTSPDFSSESVIPRMHENYDGGNIVLNKEENIILSPGEFDDLLKCKGQTLVTTDGTTLLGADDKAGIAEIVTAMEYLLEHPEIKHGKVRIGFTPDEEVGKGANLFDVEKFAARFAYTLDGGELGELEYENFNAADAKVTIKGVSVHPANAKNKMINSIHIGNEFISRFPKNEVPEKTSGYEGFYHLFGIEGNVEKTTLQYIIRDHNRKRFEERKSYFLKQVKIVNKIHGRELITVKMNDQYYNMREKIEPEMYVVDIARKAMEQAGIQPIVKAIRGGTDGAQLSFKGLPCPNIFTGGYNFHGRYEFIPVESMKKAMRTIVNIVKITAEEKVEKN